MWDKTPWFVGGGAQHSAEVARVLAYAAMGGSEGVIEPLGLKVLPRTIPGAGVRVLPGAIGLLNRYPGGGEQMYGGRHPTETDVPTVQTGSGTQRTDLLVARVRDHQYSGTAPSDPTQATYIEFEVIQGVPENITRFDQLSGRNYPAIALAKWTLPPSTGTVTAGMITDLRVLAQPRTKRVVEMNGPTPNVALVGSGSVWPSYTPTIAIPSWATHMSVIATVASIGYQNGSVTGTLAASAGPAGANQWRSSNTTYDLDVAVNDGARTTLVIGGKGAIPTALRGTSQTFRVEGSRTAFTGQGALITRPGTHVIYDVFFEESVL